MVKKLVAKKKKLQDRVIPAHGTAPSISTVLRKLPPPSRPRHASTTTVRRDLRALKCKPFVRPKRPFQRAEKHVIAKRLKMTNTVARETSRMTSVPFEDRFVFSDEHWASINDNSTRIQWSRCRSKVLPRDRKARRNTKCVQLWAAIGVNFKSKMIFVRSSVDEEGKTRRMNARQYIDRCLARSGLLPHLLATGTVFQQDGAKPHVAKKVYAYLDRKGVNVLKEWASYSPDLNPIEELWGELDRRRSERYGIADSVADLEHQLQTVWEEDIPFDLVNKYVRSFRKKLAACMAARGE